MAKDKTQSTTPTSEVSESPIAPNTVLKLTLKWAEVEPVYNSVLRHAISHLKMSGFRQGKAPAALAEAQIGHEKLVNATLDKIVPHAYQHLIADSKKQPLSDPSFNALEVDKGKDWVLEVHIAERPAIKLGDYQKLIKEAKKEAEVEIKKQKAALTEAKPAKTAEKTKDEADKAEKTPKPELTQQDQDDIRLRLIMSKLVTTVKPSIPELLVQNETRRDLDQLVKTLDQLKLKLDDYLARRNLNFDQLTQEMAISAISRLQVEFLMLAMSDDQKIVASEQDIDTQIDTLKDEKMRAEQKKNPAYRQYVAGLVTRQKTIEFMLKA